MNKLGDPIKYSKDKVGLPFYVNFEQVLPFILYSLINNINKGESFINKQLQEEILIDLNINNDIGRNRLNDICAKPPKFNKKQWKSFCKKLESMNFEQEQEQEQEDKTNIMNDEMFKTIQKTFDCQDNQTIPILLTIYDENYDDKWCFTTKDVRTKDNINKIKSQYKNIDESFIYKIIKATC